MQPAPLADCPPLSSVSVGQLLAAHPCSASGVASVYSFGGRPFPGKWSVPDGHQWGVLLAALADDFESSSSSSGARRSNFLVEVRTSPLSALALDLDMPGSVGLFRAGDSGQPPLAQLLMRVAERFFSLPPASRPVVAYVASASGVKPGGESVSSFHWHWPTIVASCETQALFAAAVRDECARYYGDAWLGRSWEKLIDGSIYAAGKGLRMLWCDKQERNTLASNGMRQHGRPKVPHAVVAGSEAMERLALPSNRRERWLFGVATSIRRVAGTPATAIAAAGITAAPTPNCLRKKRPLSLPAPPQPASSSSSSSAGDTAADPFERLATFCLAQVRQRSNPTAEVASRPQLSRIARNYAYVAFKNAHVCGFRTTPHRSNCVYVMANVCTLEVYLRCHDRDSCQRRQYPLASLPLEVALPLQRILFENKKCKG